MFNTESDTAQLLEHGTNKIPLVKIGGPYKICISFVGFNNIFKRNSFLNIGHILHLDFTPVN